MTTFPFLSLPFLPKALILEKMEPCEVALLSFSSKNMPKLIKHSKVKIEELLFDWLLIGKEEAHINIQPLNWELSAWTVQNIQEVHLIVEKSCKKKRPEFSKTEFCAADSTFRKLEYLELPVFVEWSYKHQSPFGHRNIRIKHGSWITINCLLGMECETLEAGTITLTCQDLNVFFKSWMTGCYENLRSMVLTGIENVSLDVMLEGIPTFPWQPDHAGRNDIGKELRRSDGRRAVVDVYYTGRALTMTVLKL